MYIFRSLYSVNLPKVVEQEEYKEPDAYSHSSDSEGGRVLLHLPTWMVLSGFGSRVFGW